ncbi:hypothetical protein Plhal304r1_c035g0109171 [Plasmopara halstedii]
MYITVSEKAMLKILRSDIFKTGMNDAKLKLAVKLIVNTAIARRIQNIQLAFHPSDGLRRGRHSKKIATARVGIGVSKHTKITRMREVVSQYALKLSRRSTE